ncbi:MAG: hypothetical protein ACRCX7_11105 [Cetobacterium sp.]|uniref:hypothetical protein n=1 Tax=Cetobacterium sp. TaxID=2071632 RepID=UPI003F3019A7
MKSRKVIVNVYQDAKSGGEYTYTFNYPDSNIMFKVSQTDSENPDNCFIKISGIDKRTYSIFNTEKNSQYTGTQRVEVYYGYDSDLSLAFSGTIDRAVYTFDGGSQTLMLLVTKNTRKFANMIKSVSLSGKQTISDAVSNICREFGYKYKFGEGDFSSVSIGRFCATTTFSDAMKSVLPKDYGFYTKENEVFIYHKDKSVPNEIVVWSQNGLLAYPTEDSKQETTTIKTILMPNIESGMKIKVPIDEYWFSPVDTGTYKTYIVNNYNSVFQNGIGTTEFECEGGLGV